MTRWVALDLMDRGVQGEWTLGSEEFSAHREVLIAISSLIRAGRSEAALSILDHELGGGL